MLSGKRIMHIALGAVLLALGGCSDMPIPASIRAQQPQIQFRTDYEQARQEARRASKPLMVVIKTKWCPFSREMLRETFTHREVVDASGSFVCVLVDAEEQAELCGRLNVKAVYPTTQFIGANGTVLARLEGSRTPRELLGEMHSALAR
jgi:hypothetical protein